MMGHVVSQKTLCFLVSSVGRWTQTDRDRRALCIARSCKHCKATSVMPMHCDKKCIKRLTSRGLKASKTCQGLLVTS